MITQVVWYIQCSTPTISVSATSAPKPGAAAAAAVIVGAAATGGTYAVL